MLKRTVNYEDYNGEKRTEDCYFNLNKTELMEVALELPDSIFDGSTNPNDQQIVRKIVEALGTKGLFEFIKKLLLRSYGVKTPDGKRFIKMREKPGDIAMEFEQTPIFDALFIELISDDKAAADFINAIVPKDIASQLADKIAGETVAIPMSTSDTPK